jgi:cob(I)alamin adenosyltransferase
MEKKSKPYTRTGDEGKTSLIGGRRVAKYDLRVDTYGTVDELSAYVGVLSDIDKERRFADFFVELQNKLLTVESLFALDNESEIAKQMPSIEPGDIDKVEHLIDELNEELPPLRAFVLPGGELRASYAHVCRTVCRRAERMAWRLHDEFGTNMLAIKYLNRLSDLFFVMARYYQNQQADGEVAWEPK